MRLLVLGGTRFLSRAAAEVAVERGHEVTCACRGASGPLPEGATHVPWDRAEEAPAALVDGHWDAVVDVSRTPSHVRRAVAAVPDAHWVFVSTISVYPDTATPGSPATLAVHEPLDDEVDLGVDPEAYGPMKVACERVVESGAASSLVVRPGLIVGPGDPSGRFTYWPDRLARAADDGDGGGGGEVLAGGSPKDVVQVVDVRDLAAWLVDCCESRRTGVLDAVGDPVAMGDLLAQVGAGVGLGARLTWVPGDFLAGEGVQPWSGPRSIPLWLPRPEFDGMLHHARAPSRDAGLRVRSLAATARDTLAWLRATPDAPVTGLTADEEREVLARWHTLRG